ncbi:MAG TPA: DUF4282 domain-containing protein [Gaiellaceae bacterium]|nr:DUF4282 domain-containing protein [Gaiellaceae bacterium]
MAEKADGGHPQLTTRRLVFLSVALLLAAASAASVVVPWITEKPFEGPTHHVRGIDLGAGEAALVIAVVGFVALALTIWVARLWLWAIALILALAAVAVVIVAGATHRMAEGGSWSTLPSYWVAFSLAVGWAASCGVAYPPARQKASAGAWNPQALRETQGQRSVADFLTFRTMLAPVVIQILFWLGIASVVVSGITYIAVGAKHHRGSEWAGGIALLVFGPLVVRLYCEILIVIFRINDSLADIRKLGIWAAERAYSQDVDATGPEPIG